jgi:hypothetical protein
MATQSPSSDNVVFGRGAVFLDRFDANGNRSGFEHLGNCDRFAFTITTETVEMTDYTTETSAPYKEVVKKTDVGIQISGFEFSVTNLANALMGTKSTYSQTSQNVSAETLVASTITNVKGKYFKTSKRNISSPTLIQGTSTLTTADYEIQNANAGLIRIKPAAPVAADGADITINYTAAAISTALDVVYAATRSAIEGQLLFIPDNTTGPDNEVIAWRVSLRPDGEIGFISEEFAKWNLTGKALSDATNQYGGSASSPYANVIGQS